MVGFVVDGQSVGGPLGTRTENEVPTRIIVQKTVTGRMILGQHCGWPHLTPLASEPPEMIT